MTFTSFSFLLFVAAVFVVYFILPRRVRWLVLLGASLAYCWMCSKRLIVWLVLTSMTVYIAALWLHTLNGRMAVQLKENKEKAAQEAIRKGFLRKKRWVLAGVLGFNFMILALTKYMPLLQSIASLFSSMAGREPLTLPQVFTPLGISFYTFQSASYVIDVYRGKQEAQRNPLRVLLFLSFFPQIVQGPISRYNQLAPQLFEGNRFSFEQAKRGILLIGWGFVKKLLLADRLSVLVTAVFGHSSEYGGAMMLAASVLYGVQIYADFSAGIDITIGIARVLGITVTQNFRQPYFATSLSDFWRRWHITLGSWMRDYLFYPIGMSRPFARLGRWIRKRWGIRWNKVIVAGIISFLVFTVVGIWHGPELKYIVYGFYNGFIIMAATMCEPLFERFFERTGIDPKSRLWHIFRIVRTFVLVTFGRCIVRSNGVNAALQSLGRIFTQPRWGELRLLGGLGLQPNDFLIIVIIFLMVAAVDWIAEYVEQPLDWLGKRPIVIRWLVYFLMIFMLMMLTPVTQMGGEFIYARF